MRTKEQWQIRYVPREHNIVVDRLAKPNLKWKSSLQVFDMTPTEVLEFLKQNGTSDDFFFL